MSRKVVYIFLNIVAFILLRYLTVIIYFLAGGIGNNYQYSFWMYVPALFLQITLMIFLKNIKAINSTIQYGTILILLVLFICIHFELFSGFIFPR